MNVSPRVCFGWILLLWSQLLSRAQSTCEVHLTPSVSSFVSSDPAQGSVLSGVGRGLSGAESRAVAVFNIPDAVDHLLWAELRLFAKEISTPDVTEIIELHAVTFPADAIAGNSSLELFTALAGGPVVATVTVTPKDGAPAPKLPGALLRAHLNETGLSALRSATGQRWTVGITLSTLGSSALPEYALNQSGNPYPPVSLVLGLAATSDRPEIELEASSNPALIGGQFTVVGRVCGATPMNLQWFKDSTPLPAQTNEVLAIPALQAMDSGLYTLMASNAFGVTSSAPLDVVASPLSLDPLPSSLQISEGAKAIEVQARSALASTFQWRKNGVPIPGATDARIVLLETLGLTNGNFDVVVSNSSGSQTSTVVHVVPPVINPPPPAELAPQFFSTVPGNGEGVLGLAYDFNPPSWAASPAPTFRWEKDGMILPETNSFIHFSQLKSSDAGVYRLTLSNKLGSATSAPFKLITIPLTLGVDSQLVWLGDTARIRSTVIEGQGPFSYGWEHNGKSIPGATNRDFTIDFVTAADQGGYKVRATNQFGSREASMTLDVQTNLSALTLGPDRALYPIGQSTALGPFFAGGPQTEKWHWQWFRNGQALVGETNRILRLNGAEADGGKYTAQFRIGDQVFTSLGSDLQFVAQPVSFNEAPFLERRAKLRGLVTLGTTATGGPPPQYQWEKDGTPLAGETNAYLTFKQLKKQHAGTYVLVAGNGATRARYTNILSTEPAHTLDRWSWRSPLPQGSVLWDITFGNGRFVAGGKAGVLASSRDGETWEAAFLDPRLNVTSLRYSDGEFRARTFMDPTFWPRSTPWEQANPPGPIEFRSSDGLVWTTDHTDRYDPVASQFESSYRPSFASLRGRMYFVSGQVIYRLPEPPESSPAIVFQGTTANFTGLRLRGSTLYALVNSSSAMPYFYTSTDGSTWTPQPSSVWLSDVLFDSAEILIGATQTAGQLAVRLANGSWKVVDSGTDQPIHDLTFGNDLFVGVGGGGAIVTSRDALHWAALDSSQLIDLYGLAVKDGRIAAAGESGTILTSADARNWSSANSGTKRDLHDVATGGGHFVAVGRKGAVVISEDGLNWRARSTPISSDLSRSAYANGTWMAVGEEGVLLRSTDASHWEALDSNLFTTRPTDHEGIAFGRGVWVAVGGYFEFPSGSAISTIVVSWDDGKTWQLVKPGYGKRLRDVAFGADLFVAVGNDGLVLVSQNGTEWSATEVDATNFRRVRFAGGRFIAVGNEGVAYSSNRPGEKSSWERHALPTSQNLHNILELADGTFVSVGNNGMILQSAARQSRFRTVRQESGTVVLGIEPGLEPSLSLEISSDLNSWTTSLTEPDDFFSAPATAARGFYRLKEDE